MLGFNKQKKINKVCLSHTHAQTQNRSYIGRVIEFPTFRKMTLHFHTVIHSFTYIPIRSQNAIQEVTLALSFEFRSEKWK